MIQLGITGGIGSGKTTVCKVLEHLGIPVYNADEEAKKILDSTPIQKKVKQTFGPSLVDLTGRVDRKKLAELVFQDKHKLELLNSIIHPALALHYKAWLKTEKHASFVAKEAAILFESGSYKQMDKIITIYAPKELRIKRAMLRSNATRAEILSRMSKQISEREKIKRADFVIYNDEKKMLVPQVIKIFKQLNYF